MWIRNWGRRQDDLLLTLNEKSYRHLPVTDEAGSFVGIVTQSDLIRSCAAVIEQLDKENKEALGLP